MGAFAKKMPSLRRSETYLCVFALLDVRDLDVQVWNLEPMGNVLGVKHQDNRLALFQVDFVRTVRKFLRRDIDPSWSVRKGQRCTGNELPQLCSLSEHCRR